MEMLHYGGPDRAGVVTAFQTGMLLSGTEQ